MSDNDALVNAIRQANMEELLPKLLVSAKSILRRRKWSGGKDYQPSAMEAQELVNETLTRIFVDQQRPQFDGDLRKAIVIAMTSITASTAKKLRKVTLTGNVEENVQECAQSHEENDGDAEVLDAVQALVSSSGDSELEEYLLGVEYYGPRRDDIADGLRWKPDKVSVVSKRLKRLIKRSSLDVRKRQGLQ